MPKKGRRAANLANGAMAKAVQRPDVGLQQEFRATKPSKTYRFDSSLDPALSWDENRDRKLAEWLLGPIVRASEEGQSPLAILALRTRSRVESTWRTPLYGIPHVAGSPT